jgi:stage V sporulation protein G
MEITRVKIGLCDGDDRVKAYASITLDHCFVIHGRRLTYSKKGYFLFMPGRKMAGCSEHLIRTGFSCLTTHR